ncbi:MAG: DUF4384 domain-containing protein [Candidatus Rokuibacteriota bacterium]
MSPRIIRLGATLVLAGCAAAGVTPHGLDPDEHLGALLAALRREVRHRDPGLASARAVVINFTVEGLPWSSPLGAWLEERVARVMEIAQPFPMVAGPRTRGITIKQLAGVDSPNEPKALTAFYDAELAIAGSYRWQREEILVGLTAFDDQGRVVARVGGEVPVRAVPDQVITAEVNFRHTGEFLKAFDQLGTRAQGDRKVEVTTNRPGAGASFRRGEEIRYFVVSTVDGFLYLFHIDADGKMLRIFPNQHRREGRVQAGIPVEVPGDGAPFGFEASPPFGLETTLAIVTPVPLDEKDFEWADRDFKRPMRDVPSLVSTRIGVSSGDAGAPPVLVWNTITVLIRP